MNWTKFKLHMLQLKMLLVETALFFGGVMSSGKKIAKYFIMCKAILMLKTKTCAHFKVQTSKKRV